MKISSKIILLAGVLLGFLAGNAFISWQEINKISLEFNHVVKGDLALMESSSSLNELQLKKEILFDTRCSGSSSTSDIVLSVA